MLSKPIFIACFLLLGGATLASDHQKPNVIFILCDDLNDYVEGFGGHPQTKTPNLARLGKTGFIFTQAHCNSPICAPSRASLFTGIYPHNSGCYGFQKWTNYEVLRNSRTIMDYFRENGYHTLGTGKLMHHLQRSEWIEYGNHADYGPFAYDGKEKLAHPDTPAPFREIGSVDGSFGPLINLSNRTAPSGAPYRWLTGSWGKQREMVVNSDDDRDLTGDERNGQWAVRRLKKLAKEDSPQPFFMGIGFLRPHTPLIVPKEYFDRFPLDSIQLPTILEGDAKDTYSASARGNLPDSPEAQSKRPADIGTDMYERLVASYETREIALKRFVQAYLACVASVDDQIGKILDLVDNTRLKQDTIIIVTSDHGWTMGQKDYLYKNALWQESTRIPLIIRVPGASNAGAVINQPVSLIDIYPTLVDLCQLEGDTKKNDKGHDLDGNSIKPLIENPDTNSWSGPSEVLTALFKWNRIYKPSEQSYSLRNKDWRYIRYRNGKEELYHTAIDPHEWHNLIEEPSVSTKLAAMRKTLTNRLPDQEFIPTQGITLPKK